MRLAYINGRFTNTKSYIFIFFKSFRLNLLWTKLFMSSPIYNGYILTEVFGSEGMNWHRNLIIYRFILTIYR